jgi:tetratricopeptide (TPR) repeat protein
MINFARKETIAILAVLVSLDCIAQEEPPFYSLYEEAVKNSHLENYDEAIRVSTSIREQYPDEPAGVFGFIAVYQSITRNYRTRRFEDELDSLLTLSIELAKESIEKDKRNGRNYFYLGAAYGSRCLFRVREGKWIDALRDGSQVTSNFEKAVRYDPEFYDAYYGIGLFQYWMNAQSSIVRAMPFAKGNRDEGIEHVKIALEKGRFLKTDACFGLLAVYQNEEMNEEALQLAEELYLRFPNNPNLNYRMGCLNALLSRWGEAVTSFSKTLEILKGSEFPCLSYQVECLYHMARCEYQQNNYSNAQAYSTKALALANRCDFTQELDGPLTSYEDVLDSLEDLHEQLGEASANLSK